MNPYEETIEVLEKYGWIQGQAGSTHMGFCLSGALTFTCNKRYRVQPLDREVLIRREHELLTWRHFFIDTSGIGCIPNWNDTPGRTKEEVLEELRIVAKAWANKND